MQLKEDWNERDGDNKKLSKIVHLCLMFDIETWSMASECHVRVWWITRNTFGLVRLNYYCRIFLCYELSRKSEFRDMVKLESFALLIGFQILNKFSLNDVGSRSRGIILSLCVWMALFFFCIPKEYYVLYKSQSHFGLYN